MKNSSVRRILFAACAAMLQSGAVFAVPPADLASRQNKGILVLHVGSDWCVSGDDVRKVFLSPEFKGSVGKNYVLAVYDDMDRPTEKVKESNREIEPVRVPTRRYPAITCITPRENKFFAQIENIPRNVTPAKLASAVKKVTVQKDKAEALFRKAEALSKTNPQDAVDAYGRGFDILIKQAGDFTADRVYKGKLAYEKEWNALRELDKGDKYGWVLRFTMGPGVDLVAKANKFREDGDFSGGANFIASLKAWPKDNLSNNQKQALIMAEYALYRKDDSRKDANTRLLEEAEESDQ